MTKNEGITEIKLMSQPKKYPEKSNKKKVIEKKIEEKTGRPLCHGLLMFHELDAHGKHLRFICLACGKEIK